MSGSQDTNDNRRLERGSRNRRYSPSAGLYNRESHKLMPTLIALNVIQAFITAGALAIACWALSESHDAEFEARKLSIKVEGFYRALIAKGIDPNPHLEGESP